MRGKAGAALLRLPVLLLLAALLGGGCAGPAAKGGAPSAQSHSELLCAPRMGARREPPPAMASGDIDRLVGLGGPRTAAEVADAIGAGEPLLRLAVLEAEGRRGTAAQLRILHLRQAVTDRIMLAMLDVSGMLAAIDCEGERGDQLRVRLQGIENRRARRLGVASIMVGALTAALSGGLSVAGSGSADVVAMVGGLGEASVATALLVSEASGELRTERNLLRDIREQPARSELFPAPVWQYLTRRPGGEASQPSIADTVVAAWRAAELLGEPGSEAERSRATLLFGPGGTYTVEELEVRDAMLDLLEASIALMSEDLRMLLQELPAAGGQGPAGR
jgi:hypothetical protein